MKFIYFVSIMVNEHFCWNFAVVQSANFSDFKCDIPELNGDNYKIWKERILLHLGWMDIDYAIRKDEPSAIAEADLYEKWERSNRLSVMFIKTKISVGIRGSLEQYENPLMWKPNFHGGSLEHSWFSVQHTS